jgi:hypothetical protein
MDEVTDMGEAIPDHSNPVERQTPAPLPEQHLAMALLLKFDLEDLDQEPVPIPLPAIDQRHPERQSRCSLSEQTRKQSQKPITFSSFSPCENGNC